MYGFHFLVWLFAVRGIRDTQCGFKLLTRQAARVCFLNMHVERWYLSFYIHIYKVYISMFYNDLLISWNYCRAFDVELLYIAQRLKIDIAEVAVNWTEIDGSKVTPVWSWIQMGTDLFLIWLRYRIGAWKLRNDDWVDLCCEKYLCFDIWRYKPSVYKCVASQYCIYTYIFIKMFSLNIPCDSFYIHIYIYI